jgi:aspartate dehydrogenase
VTPLWKKRIGVVGYGAITEEIVSTLEAQGALGEIAAVLVRPAHLVAARSVARGRLRVVDAFESVLHEQVDVIVEAAGHAALAEHAPRALASGIDVIVASVGALADAALARSCAATGARASLWIPSGAVAGIDGLLAARTAGLERVRYTSVKPLAAWNGTPAERLLSGHATRERTVFFDGTAREAARDYPKNANVGATVAFAGIGLDRTRVKLVCDPAASAPLGVIEAEGSFGSFRFDILAHASPRNPKTSLLTAHSLVAAWRERVCFRLAEKDLRAGALDTR